VAPEVCNGFLLYPSVGTTKVCDVPAAVRMESDQLLLERDDPEERVLLAGFPAPCTMRDLTRRVATPSAGRTTARKHASSQAARGAGVLRRGRPPREDTRPERE
jgi:hypothetical protein